MIIGAFWGVAVGCKTSIPKPFSLLRLAPVAGRCAPDSVKTCGAPYLLFHRRSHAPHPQSGKPTHYVRDIPTRGRRPAARTPRARARPLPPSRRNRCRRPHAIRRCRSTGSPPLNGSTARAAQHQPHRCPRDRREDQRTGRAEHGVATLDVHASHPRHRLP